MKERIQKLLASAGIASRRHIEEMVLQGRVKVNGKVAIDLPILVDPREDRVEVDDEPVRLATRATARRTYILLNKPKGVVCTNVAQGEQLRAIDLLPRDLRARVYPVGRLDADSRGLLLLTDDGELTNRLTHPRYGVPKTYRAVVDGFITPQVIEQMQGGVWLAEKSRGKAVKTGRVQVQVKSRGRDRSVMEITLREGHNRQVRRMLAQVGHKVRDLMRIRMGPLTLHGLAPGQSRLLTPREVGELREMINRKGSQGLRMDPARAGPATQGT